MAWEVFTGKGTKSEFAFPVATIHRNGGIALNDAAMRLLTRAERVDILYDPLQPSLIGIRPNVDGDFAPRIAQGGRAAILAAASFFRFIGFRIEEARRYRVEVQEGGVVIIDLDTPLAPAIDKRRPKSRARGEQTEGD